jgi:hypothetical protein
MAGPTSIQVKKNGRASDAVMTNAAAGLNALGVTVIIDSDNMTRGEAVLALQSVKEVLLEGKYPPY